MHVVTHTVAVDGVSTIGQRVHCGMVTYVYLVEDPETGLWCDHCSLPAAVRIKSIEAVSGAKFEQTWCDDCGRDL